MCTHAAQKHGLHCCQSMPPRSPQVSQTAPRRCDVMPKASRYSCHDVWLYCIECMIRIFRSWQWHLVLLFGLVLTLVSVPLRLAFDVGSGTLEAFEDLVDVFFWVDIATHLMRYRAGADSERPCSMIVLAMTLLGSVPLEHVVPSAQGANRILRVVRWNELEAALLSLPSDSTIPPCMAEELDSGSGSGFAPDPGLDMRLRSSASTGNRGRRSLLDSLRWWRMWRIFAVIALCGHWVACAFYALALQEAEAGVRGTWPELDGMWRLDQEGDRRNINNTTEYNTIGQQVAAPSVHGLVPHKLRFLRSSAACYRRALYWAYITLVTTGFGDIVPHTTAETMCCIAAIYVGVLVTCCGLANLTLMVSGTDSVVLQQKRRAQLLQQFLSTHGIAPAQQARIASFTKHFCASSEGTSTLSTCASFQFAQDIRSNLSGPILDRVQLAHPILAAPFLRQFNASLLRAVSVQVHHRLFLRGEDIVVEGDVMRGLYCIVRGQAQVFSQQCTLQRPDKCRCDKSLSCSGVQPVRCLVRSLALSRGYKFMQILRAGEHFGSDALHGYMIAKFAVRAEAFCEVAELSRAMFSRIVAQHATDYERNLLHAHRCPHTFGNRGATILQRHLRRLLVQQFAGKPVPGHVIRNVGPDAATRWGKHWTSLAECIARMDERTQRWKTRYWLLAFVAVTLTAIMLPLDLGLMLDESSFMPPYAGLRFRMVCNYVLDAMGLAELLYATILHHMGTETFVLQATSWRAATVAALPLDVFALNPVVGVHTLPLLRLNKMARLLRLPVLLQRAVESLVPRNRVVTQRLLMVCYALMLTAHWSSMGWLLVASTSYRYGAPPTMRCIPPNLTLALAAGSVGGCNWISTDLDDPTKAIDQGAPTSVGMVTYLRAFYWVLIGTSTIGYGDIVPTNDWETVYATVLLLFFGLVNPAILSGMSSLFFSCPSVQQYNRQPIIDLQQFAESKLLPHNLKTRLLKSWCETNDGVTLLRQHSILMDLAVPLRVEVMRHVSILAMSRTSFLDHIVNERECLSELLSRMQPRSYHANDVIVKANMPVHEMLVLISGTVTQVLPIEQHGEKLSCGTLSTSSQARATASLVFGEEALLPSVNAPVAAATCIARAELHCFSLSRVEFCEFADLFPRQAKRVRQGVEDILARKYVRRTANVDVAPEISDSDLIGREIQQHKCSNSCKTWTLLWQVCLFFSLCYNMILVPARLAGFVAVDRMIVCDWALDMCLVLDVVHKRASKRWLHAFALFPWEVHVFVCYPHWSYMVALSRTPKVMLISQFLSLGAHIERRIAALQVHRSAGKSSAALVRLVGFFVRVLLLSHWFGCIFFAVALLQHEDISLKYFDITHISKCAGLNLQDVSAYGASSKALCQFRGTWVQQQMNSGLLPPTGGTTWERYVRSLYWSFSTLLVVVIGDVHPISASETLFCVIVTLTGMVVNAYLIGSMASVVASLDTAQARFGERVDDLRRWMRLESVPFELRDHVQQFVDYRWSRENGIDEQAILRTVPHQLRVDISMHCRLRHLSQCKLFHSLTAPTLQRLALSMTQHSYSPGDIIINACDPGAPIMIFCDPHTCHILDCNGEMQSTQSQCFGARWLFNEEPPSNTVCASDYADVYVLGDEGKRIVLTAGRRPRHNSSLCNLDMPMDRPSPTSNLAKLESFAGTDLDSTQDACQVACRMWSGTNASFSPGSGFRLAWECSRVALTVCIVLVVPFRFAFLQPEKLSLSQLMAWFAIDYATDTFFVIDMWLQKYHFSFFRAGQLVCNKREIALEYARSGRKTIDLAALFPFDLVAVCLGDAHILQVTRLFRLVRALALKSYITQVGWHLRSFGHRICISTVRCLYMFSILLILNHWYACVWMAIHRYMEAHSPMTWAIADGLAQYDSQRGSHNICYSITRCYCRALYAVVVTMSTVGYGDIGPRNTLEIGFQMIVAMSGACVFGGVIGSLTSVFLAQDRQRISSVSRQYACAQYVLPSALRRWIAEHMASTWKRHRGLLQHNVTSMLPLSLQMELAMHTKGHVMQQIPLFRDMDWCAKRQLALALRLEPFTAGQYVYRVGGTNLHKWFFIGQGWATMTPVGQFGNRLLRTGSICGSTLKSTYDHNVKCLVDCDIYTIKMRELDVIIRVLPRREQRSVRAFLRASNPFLKVAHRCCVPEATLQIAASDRGVPCSDAQRTPARHRRGPFRVSSMPDVLASADDV